MEFTPSGSTCGGSGQPVCAGAALEGEMLCLRHFCFISDHIRGRDGCQSMCSLHVYQRSPDHRSFLHLSPLNFIISLSVSNTMVVTDIYPTNTSELRSIHAWECWVCYDSIQGVVWLSVSLKASIWMLLHQSSVCLHCRNRA